MIYNVLGSSFKTSVPWFRRTWTGYNYNTSFLIYWRLSKILSLYHEKKTSYVIVYGKYFPSRLVSRFELAVSLIKYYLLVNSKSFRSAICVKTDSLEEQL